MSAAKKLLPLLSAVLLALGCGADRAPVASTDTAADAPSSYIVFAPAGVAPKLAGGTGDPDGTAVVGFASDVITAAGGSLLVAAPNGPGPADDIAVQLVVQPNSINYNGSDKSLIAMMVTGSSLSGLVVEFQPAGLVFAPWANLRLVLGQDLVDLWTKRMVAWHIHDDGTVEEVPFEIVIEDGERLELNISVPGFSRYGMGGGA